MQGSHPLAERMEAYFRGERVRFDDVDLEWEQATPFQEALARALREAPGARS